jgi:hypothetical protein
MRNIFVPLPLNPVPVYLVEIRTCSGSTKSRADGEATATIFLLFGWGDDDEG